jgi:hypothetical protein
MTMQRQVLAVAAALECLTGVAAIVIPGIVIAPLLGVEPSSAALMTGRLLGVTLLSLGIACWYATTDNGGSARTGTLRAITLYNAGVGSLLVEFAATGIATGYWPGSPVGRHLVLPWHLPPQCVIPRPHPSAKSAI